jgi:hypothetical protein
VAQKDTSPIRAVFPLTDTELVVLMTAPLAQSSARDLEFSSALGLKLKVARMDPSDPARVILRTNMHSDSVVVDRLTVRDVLLDGARRRVGGISPPFVPGVRDPMQLKVPHLASAYPYPSTLIGVHVTVACCTGCNGGVHDRDLVVLNHHIGGPWTGIWVRTAKTIDAPYPRWQKIMCAGGVVAEHKGSTNVVDEGWMEIHKLFETPHHAPPPLPVTSDECSQRGKALFLKGLDASWVQFEDIRVESAQTVIGDGREGRTVRLTRNEIVFTDSSGGRARAYLYQPSGLKIQPGQALRRLRGFVHVERPGRYVVLSDKEEDITA